MATSCIDDRTLIHAHWCYSEFHDIIQFIAALDTDVISIESSRNKMELLEAFIDYHHPSELGPGVYDIHSSGVPLVDEIA